MSLILKALRVIICRGRYGLHCGCSGFAVWLVFLPDLGFYIFRPVSASTPFHVPVRLCSSAAMVNSSTVPVPLQQIRKVEVSLGK